MHQFLTITRDLVGGLDLGYVYEGYGKPVE